jgi:uncharacterized RDD family membrane protein YckC
MAGGFSTRTRVRAPCHDVEIVNVRRFRGVPKMSNQYAPPQAVVQDIALLDENRLPADRVARFCAALLDGLAVAVIVYAPAFAGALILGAAAPGTESGASSGALIGGLGLGVVGFAVWCAMTVKYVKQNGQTIGKKLVGIKVVRTDGAPATLGRIFWLRNLVNGLICVIPFYGLLDLLFIFGESRQCLHDKIADTIVVKA